MKKRPQAATRPAQLLQQQRQPAEEHLDIKDEAVRKATELLQLLNSELEEEKMTSHELRRQLNAERELIRTYQEREQEFRQAAHIRDELVGFRNTIERKDEEQKQQLERNRQLHLKISELLDKQKQLVDELEKERIRYASLQNENEYLIKQYSDFKQREKRLEAEQQQKEQDVRKELAELTAVKNAMATRMEELRKENNALILRAAKAEAVKPPAADPLSLIGDSELFRGLLDQMKIENELLRKEIFELNRRLLCQENRYVLEELEVSRQLNQTKKYPHEEHLLLQDSLEALFRRFALSPDSGSLLTRFNQLTDFLSKHLEYFLYVVVRISCKFLEERLQPPPQGWMASIKEAVELSELLLHKLAIY